MPQQGSDHLFLINTGGCRFLRALAPEDAAATTLALIGVSALDGAQRRALAAFPVVAGA